MRLLRMFRPGWILELFLLLALSFSPGAGPAREQMRLEFLNLPISAPISPMIALAAIALTPGTVSGRAAWASDGSDVFIMSS
jgi:hypothetical protein